MTDTIINVDRFEGTHQSGLLFSLFEGLKPGEAFWVFSSFDLEAIKRMFAEAGIHNLFLQHKTSKDGSAVVEVKKIPDRKIGCCGICGTQGD